MKKKNLIKIVLIVLIITILVPSVFVASACGPYEYDDLGQVGSSKKLASISAKNGNTKKTYIKIQAEGGIFELSYSLSNSGSATIKAYTDAEQDSEIKPVNTSGKKYYYRFHDNNAYSIKTIYFAISVKGPKSGKTTLTVNLKPNKDVLNSLSSTTFTQSVTAPNGKKLTLSKTFKESYYWTSVHQQVKDLTPKAFETQDVKISSTFIVTESIFYLNRMDTQLLYGALCTLLSGRYDSMVSTIKAAVKAVIENKNSGSKMTAVANVLKQNKDAIINCAFGVAMTLSNLPASIGGVLGSIASECLVKCSGKIANFLVGAIVSDLVESAGSLGGLSKKLYFRSDSFKTVRDKIYKIYKTDIDIINNMRLTSIANINNVMNKGTMPVLLYGGGICITIKMQYNSNWYGAGTKFAATSTTKWNDTSSSIEGAALQKGTFKKMSASTINDLVGALSKIPSISVQ